MSRVVALLAGAACLVAMLAGPAAASTADPARPSSPSQSPGPPDVTLDPPPVPPAVPEGADDGSEQPTGDVAAAAAAAPQPATRAFGRQPYADVTAAAAGEATARRAAGCGISNATLAGTLLAITFTEAGPLASTTSAPSPMTLSRWDTNARLYAFANPSTPFPRAFWHPGVGLWQFDYPWQNTATERIDTRTSAALAAQVVAGRWCTSSATSDLGRFVYAVGPWHGCDDGASDGLRCLEILSHHFRANGPGLVDDTLVGFTLQDGVTRSGGARATQCQLAGESTARPCTFVDPGAAQGNRAWTATAGMPTPLAAPFYVVRVGTQEWRYWLRADTGYDRDIVARATIGGNPRTTLVWQNGAGLCDVGTGRGSGCPCGGRCFYLSNAFGGTADVVFRDPQPANQIFYGDWDADGDDSLGFRLGNRYALKFALGATPPDRTFAYGLSTDVVLMGDWNGDGLDTPAVRRGNGYFLTNSYGGGAADVTFAYGRPDDVVLVGDWNGDGRDTLAVRRGSTYYLKNSFGGGAADVTVAYGQPADVVLVGDWNGDGLDTLAVRRGSRYYLKNSFSGGAADQTFVYGRDNDITFVGDWNGDGRDTLGVRR